MKKTPLFKCYNSIKIALNSYKGNLRQWLQIKNLKTSTLLGIFGKVLRL